MKVAPEILSLIPYQPGKPISETQREYGLTKVIKLASNESPYPPSPKVIQALQAAILESYRYPDGAAYEMKQAAAKYFGLPTDWITFGNGSDELMDILVQIYCEPGDAILTSQGAFIAYKIAAQSFRVRTVETPLKKDFSFDVPLMVEALKKDPRIRLIFLPNPNNPTGAMLTQSELAPLLKAIEGRDDVLLVIDEAYTEFVRAKDYPDGIPLLRERPNVCCLRTMSKIFALAGLRVGFLLARPEVTDLVNRVRKPFNVNSLAQVAVVAAMSDLEYLQKVRETTWQGLDYFAAELKKMGLAFVPTQGNFIFFDTGRDAMAVYQQLLTKGIIMRPLKNYGFLSHLRLSVGLMEENEQAILELRRVLA